MRFTPLKGFHYTITLTFKNVKKTPPYLVFLAFTTKALISALLSGIIRLTFFRGSQSFHFVILVWILNGFISPKGSTSLAAPIIGRISTCLTREK